MALYEAYDFSEGVDRSTAQYLISDKALRNAVNITYDMKGAIKSRMGSDYYNETEIDDCTAIQKSVRFYDKDGTTKATIIVGTLAANDKVYLGDDSAGTFAEITGGTALTAGSKYTTTIYKDTLFITNGSQPIQLWTTGTTKADITGTPTPPTGKYIKTHMDRLFLAGNATNPSRLYWCDTGDETAWDALNYTDVQTNDGGIIAGLAQLGQRLIVFKNNGAYALYGNTNETFDIPKIPGLPGLLAPETLCEALGGVIWLSREGVFFYDGENFKNLSSTKIKADIEAVPAAYIEQMVGEYADEKYMLLYNDGTAGITYNNCMAVYDFKRDSWSFNKGKGWNLASLVWWSSHGDSGQIYGGSAHEGYLHKLFTGRNDCGDAIAVTIETKHINAGTNKRKHWGALNIMALNQDLGGMLTFIPIIDIDDIRGSAIVVVTLTEYWGDGEYWGTGYWGGGGIKRSRHRLAEPANSIYLGLLLEWESDTYELTFRGYDIEYDILER